MSEKTLQEMLKYYEEALCTKVFKYELNNKATITLTFYNEQFCHLFGLQHIFGNDKNFLGMRGYNRIESGELTIGALKIHDEKQYNYIKPKFDNFHKIHDILYSGYFVKFYKERCKPNTRIDADFLTYKSDEDSALLHLFLKQERSGIDIFAPVSFIVKLPGDKDYGQFIDGQERKKITGFEIIDKQNEKKIDKSRIIM